MVSKQKNKNYMFLNEGKGVTERGNWWGCVIGRGWLFFGGRGNCWGKADAKVSGMSWSREWFTITGVWLGFTREGLFRLCYINSVRAYERAPLRCYWCQDYGHVAAVCRKMVHRCRRCGKENWSEEECVLTKERVVCYHSGGNREAVAKECERRKRES